MDKTQSAQTNDLQRKTAAISGMAENFGKSMSFSLLQIWLKLLAPYPAELVEMAVFRLICEYEYKTLPPFAVLRKYLEPERPEPNLKLMAEAEWRNLLEAIGKYGIYKGPPDDLHPTTACVLRLLGGWNTACMWPEKTLDFKRKDFICAWQDVHGREVAMLSGAKALEQMQTPELAQKTAHSVLAQMQATALQ